MITRREKPSISLAFFLTSIYRLKLVIDMFGDFINVWLEGFHVNALPSFLQLSFETTPSDMDS